jgi:hypothetical protein
MPATIEASTPIRMTLAPKIEISMSENPTGPNSYAILVPKAKKPPCINAKAQINFTYSGSFNASFMFSQKGASFAFSSATREGGY